MLEDILQEVVNNLYSYITGSDEEVKGMLIKEHSVDLHIQGEFSFPNSMKSWHRVLDVEPIELENSLLAHFCKETDDFVEASKGWIIPIRKVLEIKDRVHLFLNRSYAIKIGLAKSILNNGLIKEALSKNVDFAHVDTDCEGHCTTSLRLQCMKYAINNLAMIYLTTSNKMQNLLNMVITSKSSRKDNTVNFILCGTVLNANNNLKETNISADEFVRLRQNELTLIAQHKYGVRVSSNSKWQEFIAHLGESAVTFELLQTKPSSAVKVNFHMSSGSSKGAAFILYNCARMETILRTFHEKVTDNTYPPLPDFDETDFSLLTQEEEWCLIFNYILGLPSLLKNCVQINQNSYFEFRPHLLCGFLSSMVKLISQYYRKTRILTEPRKHLLPVMFARLHMLNILNETLKTCLQILNIKSVSQM